MKKYLWKIITPISLVLFAGAFYLLTKNLNLVIALTVSVFIHELAHLVALKILGYKANLIFIPLLGAGVIPINTEKYIASPDSHKAFVAIVGPIINGLLLLLSTFFLKNPGTADLAQQMFTINFILVLINLAPIGPFDGSKVASAIISGTKSWWIKVPLMAYFTIICITSLLFFFFGYSDISIAWLTIATIVLSFLGVASKFIPSNSKTLPMTPGISATVFASYLLLSSTNIIYLYGILM